MVDKKKIPSTKKIKAENEKEFLKQIKKKTANDFLVKLDFLERERVAQYIINRFDEVKTKHNDLADEIDENDEVYRMERTPLQGDSSDMPNYRTPVTAVAIETIHSTYMNVFFTPKDVGSILPVEQGDAQKVPKLSTFMNWSVKNELNLFNQVDRLWHSSTKNGEAPYILHWVKEYATVTKREFVQDPKNPGEPLIDPDTKMPVFTEKEEQKLVYNGPKLEVFSRKDYFQPKNALADVTPDWEMRRIRLTFDTYLRDELQGKMYSGSINDITGWGSGMSDTIKVDMEGDHIPVGEWEKEFIEFYGRLRIKTISSDSEDEIEDTKELEDEFIAIVNVDDGVLCSLRKNKFPLKERPIGMDYFLIDDEGRRVGIGVVKFMDSLQKAYDALFNQFIFGTVQSNNPTIFFSPMGNMRKEPFKLKTGYAYPTSDPNSFKEFRVSPPNSSIETMLELVTQWTQLLFGISAFTAGVESKIDPDAPAKKAALIVQQGNVRMNTIIKRKNRTLKDIFRRWFLLYQENIPPNKFMRITGDSKDNPWEFQAVTLSDFALKSIPDFEITGNVINSNKALQAQKAVAVYQLLIANPLFQPQTQTGIRSMFQLTKWLIDRMDEVGLSSFLPPVPGEFIHTPEEENARFLQGDSGEPTEDEDDVDHVRKHRTLLLDPSLPEELQPIITKHINAHVEQMQRKITQQIVMSQTQGQAQPQLQGGQNAIGQGVNQGAQGAPSQAFPQQSPVLG